MSRIVFIAPFGLGQKTTVWARTLPLARFLDAQGHDVTIIIPPWDTPADAGRCWHDEGVALVNVELHGGLPLVVLRVLRKMTRLKPDIVHIVKPRAHAGIVQWLLWQWYTLRRAKRPALLLDVDDWEQAWAEINRYPWPVARFLAWQEEWGIRHADAITAASRWLAARAREYAPRTPVLYLPNGVDDQRMVNDQWSTINGQPLAEMPQTVLLFSRFVEVDAAWMGAFWREMQGLVPGVRLRIGGQALTSQIETEVRHALERATADAQALEWLGYVEKEELPALYRRTGCAIFPAQNVPLNQAKCSVRLATTLLHGVPVVASAVGEQANYGAGGAAHLVPPAATPQEFAAAVAQVLAEEHEREHLRERAREHLAQNYRWEQLGARLADFYQTHLTV